MGDCAEIDRALTLLQTEQTEAAWAVLNALPEGTPKRDLFRATCLAGFCNPVAALLLCERILARPSDAFDVQQASILRQRFLCELSQKTNEHIAREPMKISIVVDCGNLPVQAYFETLRSIEVQDYPRMNICMLGAVSDSDVSALRARFPRLSFTIFPSFTTRTDLDLNRLLQAVTQTDCDVISYIAKPVMYVSPAFRTLSEAMHSHAAVTWVTGHRLFSGPSLRVKARQRAEIRWNAEYFFDRSRFRLPSADLEIENTFFRKSFLITQLQEALQQPYACNQTGLLATAMLHQPPHSLATGLCANVSATEEEPGEAQLATARKIETLHTLAKLQPSTEHAQPVIRIQHAHDEAKTISELSQLPAAHLSGTLPKISVVVPNFNQEALLRECLTSIVSQQYPKLELIVRDGGSTDGSLRVIEEFRPHISDVTSAPDAGHYAAVHDGIRASTGDVITWINSTDLLTPWSLYSAAAVFMTRPDVSWLTGRTALITLNGRLYENNDLRSTSRARYLEGKFDSPWIQQEGTYFRASLWKDAGASMDLTYQLAGDLELWARFFRYAQLHLTTAALGIFRYHEGQRSEQGRHAYYQEALEILERERNLLGWNTDNSRFDFPAAAIISCITHGVNNTVIGPLQAQVSVEQSPQLPARCASIPEICASRSK